MIKAICGTWVVTGDITDVDWSWVGNQIQVPTCPGKMWCRLSLPSASNYDRNRAIPSWNNHLGARARKMLKCWFWYCYGPFNMDWGLPAEIYRLSLWSCPSMPPWTLTYAVNILPSSVVKIEIKAFLSWPLAQPPLLSPCEPQPSDWPTLFTPTAHLHLIFPIYVHSPRAGQLVAKLKYRLAFMSIASQAWLNPTGKLFVGLLLPKS